MFADSVWAAIMDPAIPRSLAVFAPPGRVSSIDAVEMIGGVCFRVTVTYKPEDQS